MSTADLLAIIEIQQLLYRYCRGVDRGEPSTLRSVYHEGATDNHGSYNGPGEGFADFLVPLMDAANLIGQHHITNMLIQVEGDHATGESYFLAYHPDEIPGGGKMGLAVAGGRYLDRFERRERVWKITDRRVVFDFSRAPQDQAIWRSHDSFPAGGRREADPSCGLFAADW